MYTHTHISIWMTDLVSLYSYRWWLVLPLWSNKSRPPLSLRSDIVIADAIFRFYLNHRSSSFFLCIINFLRRPPGGGYIRLASFGRLSFWLFKYMDPFYLYISCRLNFFPVVSAVAATVECYSYFPRKKNRNCAAASFLFVRRFILVPAGRQDESPSR